MVTLEDPKLTFSQEHTEPTVADGTTSSRKSWNCLNNAYPSCKGEKAHMETGRRG